MWPDRVRCPVQPHTFVSPSAELRRVVASYWRTYVHEVLVNRLVGLNLPRKSMGRLTARHDNTLDVYRGRKTTTRRCGTVNAYTFRETILPYQFYSSS